MASGRTIHPFYVELRQLVTEIEDVDIYDEELNEPLFVDDDDDKVGVLKRPEADAILLKATIDLQDFEGLTQVATGNVPSTNLKFFASWGRDLPLGCPLPGGHLTGGAFAPDVGARGRRDCRGGGGGGRCRPQRSECKNRRQGVHPLPVDLWRLYLLQHGQ